MYGVVCIASHIYVFIDEKENIKENVLHSEITCFVSKLSLRAAGDDKPHAGQPPQTLLTPSGRKCVKLS